MARRIAAVTVVVAQYDEAIAFYTRSLGFTLLADDDMGSGKRWVLVAPPGGQGAALLLAQADGDAQTRRVGDQTGGRVGFFLHTDDFERDYAILRSRGVQFEEEPRHEAYGIVAVFRDLYGNRWDLLQPAEDE